MKRPLFLLVQWNSFCFYKALWNSLCFYRALWNSLCFYRALWNSLCFYGALWNSLCFYGVLWNSLCFYGVLWRYMVHRRFLNSVVTSLFRQVSPVDKGCLLLLGTWFFNSLLCGWAYECSILLILLISIGFMLFAWLLIAAEQFFS
jgi:hypothetical protein